MKYYISIIFIVNASMAYGMFRICHDSCYIKNSIDYEYIIEEADRYFMMGDISMAELFYKKAIDAEECGAGAFYRLSQIAANKRDISNAKAYAKKAFELSKNNVYFLNYLNILEYFGEEKLAIKLLKSKIKNEKENNELKLKYSELLIKNRKIKEAEKLFREIEHKISYNDYNKIRNLLLFKKEQYIILLKELSREEILTYDDVVRKINILFIQKEFDETIKIINCYNGINRLLDNQITEFLIKNCTRESFYVLRYYILLNLKNKEFVKWLILKILDNLNKELIEKCKIVNLLYEKENDIFENESEFRLLLLNYYEKIDNIDSIEHNIKWLLKYKNNDVYLTYKLADLYAKKGLWNEILTLLKNNISYQERDLKYYYYIGISYFQIGCYTEAKDCFERILEYEIDEKFKYHIYSLLADLYYKLKDYANSDSFYELIIHEKKEDLASINNYAYYLSLRGERLDYAEKLSKYTLKKDPKNSSYLDTYAWILFRKNKCRSALKFVRKALSINKENEIIKEHYKEIIKCLKKG